MWRATLLRLIILLLMAGAATAQSVPVGDSVVPVGLLVIQPTHLPQSLERFEGQDIFLPIAYGTGFVVSESGYVVTALHVIKKAESRLVNIQSSAKQMVVCLGALPETRKCREVEVVGTDDRNDLALLKIKKSRPTEALHALHLGSGKPRRGTEIWAAGYPARTGGRLVVAPGTFSNDLPDDTMAAVEPTPHTGGMWLADMSVEDGTSGGPVYLHDGSVIGVVVARSAAHTVTGFVPVQYVIDLLVRTGVTNLLTRELTERSLAHSLDTQRPSSGIGTYLRQR